MNFLSKTLQLDEQSAEHIYSPYFTTVQITHCISFKFATCIAETMEVNKKNSLHAKFPFVPPKQRAKTDTKNNTNLMSTLLERTVHCKLIYFICISIDIRFCIFNRPAVYYYFERNWQIPKSKLQLNFIYHFRKSPNRVLCTLLDNVNSKIEFDHLYILPDAVKRYIGLCVFVNLWAYCKKSILEYFILLNIVGVEHSLNLHQCRTFL